MIIFAKADGQVIQTQPTPVYQGSSLKGSVYLVAPFPNSNGVTIQFQLPNGNVTKAYPMTPTGEIEGVKLDNAEMSIWCWDVKNSMVTAIPGVVGVTIKVYEASPNITYYGPFPTINAIENIQNPQTNAYAYCIANGKVYKYNGTAWEEGDITISSIDYLATAITTSFPVIKGVPNALPVQEPNDNEWEIIIALLNEQGAKIKAPLLTNISYNTESGVVTKYFNNYEQSTENLPRLVPDTITGNNLVSKTDFKAASWTNGILTIEKPFVDSDGDDDYFYLIEVYKKSGNAYTKMNPTITVTDNDYKIVLEGDAYEGYVLLMSGGTYAETELYNNIESAIGNANNIASTLETAYNNGDFKGEQGEQGVPGIGVPEGGTVGQVLTKTASGTAWEDAKGGSYVYSPYFTSSYGIQCLFVFPKSLGFTEATLVSVIGEFSNDEYGYDRLYINTLEEPVNFCENGVWKDLVTVNVRSRDSYYSDWVTYSAVFTKTETNDTIKYSTTEYYFGSPSKVDFIVK